LMTAARWHRAAIETRGRGGLRGGSLSGREKRKTTVRGTKRKTGARRARACIHVHLPSRRMILLTHPAAQPRRPLSRHTVESRAGVAAARREGPRGRVERPPRTRRGVPVGPEEKDRFGGGGFATIASTSSSFSSNDDAVGRGRRFKEGRAGRVVVVGNVDHGGTHSGRRCACLVMAGCDSMPALSTLTRISKEEWALNFSLWPRSRKFGNHLLQVKCLLFAHINLRTDQFDTPN
jgi:hypothetical protein